MRRILLPAVLCVLLFAFPSKPVSAGNPINPGDDPPPVICTENCAPPDDGGTNAVAPSDGISIIVDVLLFIGLL